MSCPTGEGTGNFAWQSERPSTSIAAAGSRIVHVVPNSRKGGSQVGRRMGHKECSERACAWAAGNLGGAAAAAAARTGGGAHDHAQHSGPHHGAHRISLPGGVCPVVVAIGLAGGCLRVGLVYGESAWGAGLRGGLRGRLPRTSAAAGKPSAGGSWQARCRGQRQAAQLEAQRRAAAGGGGGGSVAARRWRWRRWRRCCGYLLLCVCHSCSAIRRGSAALAQLYVGFSSNGPTPNLDCASDLAGARPDRLDRGNSTPWKRGF